MEISFLFLLFLTRKYGFIFLSNLKNIYNSLKYDGIVVLILFSWDLVFWFRGVLLRIILGFMAKKEFEGHFTLYFPCTFIKTMLSTPPLLQPQFKSNRPFHIFQNSYFYETFQVFLKKFVLF